MNRLRRKIEETRERDGGSPRIADDAGNLTEVADPLLHKTGLTYDAVGNLVFEIDAEGKTKRFGYDGKKRLTQLVDGAGGITEFKYDGAGKLILKTDPEGKTEEYRYDGRGRLHSATDGNGNATKFEYEEGSGCSSCSGRDDAPALIRYPTFACKIAYDRRGRKILEEDILSETESVKTRFGFDASGNLTSIEDPEGRITTFEYDELGRLTETVDAAQGMTRYAYDSRDNLISVTDSNGNTTRFAFDRNNRRISEIRPMGEETRITHDAAGNIETRVDAKNQKTAYIHDDAGRLAGVEYFSRADDTAPQKSVSFTWDGTSHLRGYSDGATSATYAYDDAYRRTTETVDYGSFELTSSSAWNRNGTRQSFTGPDGVTIQYTHDGANLLRSVEIPGRGFITVNALTWNRPSALSYPGGTTRQTVFDPLMRTKEIHVKDPGGNEIASSLYTRDRTGSVTAKETEHGDYAYSYDELYRLSEATSPHRSTPEAFTYDAVGNRLTSADTIDPWVYTENNELAKADTAAFTFDPNGNTVRKAVGENPSGSLITNYAYDFENRLIRVEDGDGRVIAAYTYDPFGRRLSKEASGTRTFFAYADEGLVAETDGNGTITKTYGYRPGSQWTTDPIFMKEGNQYRFYQNDPLGTPQLMTDVDGAVLWSAGYDAFGRASVDSRPGVTNNLRFPGQYFDSETGMHNNLHRYYDPESGRYPTRDPIGLAGGINPYAYCLNNPINSLDPYGLIRIAVAAMGYGDETTFIGRASQSSSDVVLNPATGREFLTLLSQNSSQGDPITSLSVYSHGYHRGIIMSNNEGFYNDQSFSETIASYLRIWDNRDIDDLIDMVKSGKIVFSNNAAIKLFGCNNATDDFAQRLADATGATVIAARGRVAPVIAKKRETGWFTADSGWYEHRPNTTPVRIGPRIFGR